LHLNVYFTPAEASAVSANPDDIYIVIDVIRATTCLAVILDRGASRVLAAHSLEQAQEAATAVPGRLLAGERGARPLPGFDFGNSPVEFARADLSGRELILTTTNGTRAFHACPPQSTRLGGCFYNAGAVTALALKLAQEKQSNIALVCAGEVGYFALDDAACAGYLALELQRQSPALRIRESVKAATILYAAHTSPTTFDDYASAQSVIAAGLQADLAMCMTIDGSTSVPMVVGRETATSTLVIEQCGRDGNG
jgi:2-phosphosulfolactate phosphatase